MVIIYLTGGVCAKLDTSSPEKSLPPPKIEAKKVWPPPLNTKWKKFDPPPKSGRNGTDYFYVTFNYIANT